MKRAILSVLSAFSILFMMGCRKHTSNTPNSGTPMAGSVPTVIVARVDSDFRGASTLNRVVSFAGGPPGPLNVEAPVVGST